MWFSSGVKPKSADHFKVFRRQMNKDLSNKFSQRHGNECFLCIQFKIIKKKETESWEIEEILYSGIGALARYCPRYLMIPLLLLICQLPILKKNLLSILYKRLTVFLAYKWTWRLGYLSLEIISRTRNFHWLSIDSAWKYWKLRKWKNLLKPSRETIAWIWGSTWGVCQRNE